MSQTTRLSGGVGIVFLSGVYYCISAYQKTKKGPGEEGTPGKEMHGRTLLCGWSRWETAPFLNL